MLDTRRSFVKSFAAFSGAVFLLQDAPPVPGPQPKTPVTPPQPAETQDTDKTETPSKKGYSPLQQEKDLRSTLEQLLTRVRDLKQQLDRLPATRTFSVTVFKQTQEIEKLAKRLKNDARG
jgi:molecular chaperone GrpE (heat shock protein)